MEKKCGKASYDQRKNVVGICRNPLTNNQKYDIIKAQKEKESRPPERLSIKKGKTK